MAKKVMSTGAQASSTRGVKASPSNAHPFGPSRNAKKKRSKNHDNLENMKLIPSILPDCIPPLARVVSRDIVPRDFAYTLIIAYLPKGICTVGLQLDRL
jgi:hypothetical protein